MTNNEKIKKVSECTEWMVKNDSLPDELKGIFFMDGNPLPDDLVTLEGGEWNAEKKILTIKFYGKNPCWTFHNTCMGRFSKYLLSCMYFNYKIYFSDDLTTGQIYPCFGRIMIPRIISSFNMQKDLINDNVWARNNLFLGCIPTGNYILRRIYDKDRQLIDKFPEEIPEDCVTIE